MENIHEIYSLICKTLASAPEEGECPIAEDEIYADMQNLKESIERANVL